MPNRPKYRGAADDDGLSNPEHNLDLMIEHARKSWDAEESNASRAAVERRILATAIVAAIGLTLSAASSDDMPGAPTGVRWLIVVSIALYIGALWSILSVSVVPDSLWAWVLRSIRRFRVAVGKNWGHASRTRGWEKWVWQKTNKRFVPKPPKRPSASWYLRLEDPDRPDPVDEQLAELATCDEITAKAVVFARVYNAFTDLQTRTSKDLRGVRIGTFCFACGIIMAAVAVVWVLLKG